MVADESSFCVSYFPQTATWPTISGGSPASTIRRLGRVGIAAHRRFERFRLAKRTGEGQTSKGRVGAWSDHRRGARDVDRDDGRLGLGRRRGLRVLCRGCAREDGRGHCRWTTHPASWPRLLRAPAARPPPRALTGASLIRRWRQPASSLWLTFCPNREAKQERMLWFVSTATPQLAT
jgi:hypothetical protein